jgi:LPXTG-motif cell wall-anchored protein
MSLKKILRGAFFAAFAAILIAIPMTAIASHGDDVNIDLNPDHEESLATDAEEGCEEFGGSAGENSDGWVFVLPAQGDPDAHFDSVTATFRDTEGNLVTREATIVDGKKATIVTPAGWTLVSATASINTTEPDQVDSFNLTHACPGVPEEPTEEPTTPDETTTDEEPTTPDETTTDEEPTTPDETTTGEEPTTPDEPTTGEEPTTPDQPTTGDEPTTPDREETTSPMAEDTTPLKPDESPAPRDDSPEPDSLNQTGSDLTVLLAAAAALVFAGLGALYLVRRRFGRVD